MPERGITSLENGLLKRLPAARNFLMFAGQTKPFLLLTTRRQRHVVRREDRDENLRAAGRKGIEK